MGSNSFLSELVAHDPINELSGGKLGTFLAPGVAKYNNVGKLNNPTAGASPQSGVAPTLAAANQGYQVAPTGGGPTGTTGQTYGMTPTTDPQQAVNKAILSMPQQTPTPAAPAGQGSMTAPNPYAVSPNQIIRQRGNAQQSTGTTF